MDSAFRPVHPVKTAAAYIGGKKQLAARLVERIAAIEHRCYAEPFIGMGGVFLRRRHAPPAEIINDLSGDVSTFFRVLQRHYAPFMDLLRFQFTSRREFDRLLKLDPATLTDLERAVRFLYLQRLTFGGKVAGRTFGVSPAMPGRLDVGKLGAQLAEISERLSGVLIENLPFADFIARYDAPGVLFYCDPPYFGSEDDYGAGAFRMDDFARLARQLAGIKGSFILSINDVPQTRRIFEGFEIEEAELTYTMAEGQGTPAKELIVSTPGAVRAEARLL